MFVFGRFDAGKGLQFRDGYNFVRVSSSPASWWSSAIVLGSVRTFGRLARSAFGPLDLGHVLGSVSPSAAWRVRTPSEFWELFSTNHLAAAWRNECSGRSQHVACTCLSEQKMVQSRCIDTVSCSSLRHDRGISRSPTCAMPKHV